MSRKTAIVIGAGPAGLTAARELIDKTEIKPIILEMTADIGGISKTVNYKGNRIDIGGHRFFSKSDRVMEWWTRILPIQGKPSRDDLALERDIPLSEDADAPDPGTTDRAMLVRNRLSRIYFLRRFFRYPIALNLDTVRNLGLLRILKIMLSYIRIRLFPIRAEASLEDFFINRFGKELYLTFFKDYTEKVWGLPCRDINSEWGAQRVKGLSISRTIFSALKKMVSREKSISQKGTETSLIEQFLYPKHGPGQLWEEVARSVVENGGEIRTMHQVVGIRHEGDRIAAVLTRDARTGRIETIPGDYFFSSMPVKDLISSFNGEVPQEVRRIADGLLYRDFITVGLLLGKLKIRNDSNIRTVNDIVPDNWIYVQEKDVRLGRIQIFNNWSPYLVRDEGTVWLGLEYFCNEGDDLWNKPDSEFLEFAADELVKMDFIERDDVLDGVVIRMPKTYPGYFGSYEHFDRVRRFTDRFENLFLIGRNGMHRYNNQDHSMLTAMIAVENIVKGTKSKDNLWAVNAEDDYHERKEADSATPRAS